MPLFDWNDTFRVNVAAIDEQHKKLVGLINEFHDSTEKRRADEILARLLADLLDYADYHFRTEEALMNEHGYPGRGTHVGDHDDFRDRVLHFERIRSWVNQDMSSDIAQFLTNWLTFHIKGTDRQLGKFLNAKGVV